MCSSFTCRKTVPWGLQSCPPRRPSLRDGCCPPPSPPPPSLTFSFFLFLFDLLPLFLPPAGGICCNPLPKAPWPRVISKRPLLPQGRERPPVPRAGLWPLSSVRVPVCSGTCGAGDGQGWSNAESFRSGLFYFPLKDLSEISSCDRFICATLSSLQFLSISFLLLHSREVRLWPLHLPPRAPGRRVLCPGCLTPEATVLAVNFSSVVALSRITSGIV